MIKYSSLYPDNIKLTTTSLTFYDNILHELQSNVLLDFKTPIHKGLSFRTIEAVGYQKKLITTNDETRKYDFYHPDNIFIWDGESFDGIDEFLAKPYYEIDLTIREKYSFNNWIRYILDIEPHQKIQLPII